MYAHDHDLPLRARMWQWINHFWPRPWLRLRLRFREADAFQFSMYFHAIRGWPPSVKDFVSIFRCKSATVYYQLRNFLERKGYWGRELGGLNACWHKGVVWVPVPEELVDQILDFGMTLSIKERDVQKEISDWEAAARATTLNTEPDRFIGSTDSQEQPAERLRLPRAPGTPDPGSDLPG